jgi:hypothetical protein
MLNRILENTLRLVLPPMKWAMHAYPTKQLLRFPWVCLCPKQAGHAAAVGVLAPNVADLISYGTTAHGHRTARPAISNRDLGGGGALGLSRRFLPALLRAFVAFGAKSRARSHVFGAKELRPRANGRSRLRGVGPVQARSSSLPPVPVLSCPGGWSWTTPHHAGCRHWFCCVLLSTRSGRRRSCATVGLLAATGPTGTACCVPDVPLHVSASVQPSGTMARPRVVRAIHIHRWIGIHADPLPTRTSSVGSSLPDAALWAPSNH